MATINHSRASPPRLAGARIGRIAARARCLHTHTARGQGLVEYALILVLIAVIVIGVLSTLGAQTSRVFDQVNCALGTLSHQDQGNGNSNRCN
jgi:pilus assembly protein Flp/PilA